MDKVIELHLQGYGRGRISQQLGISERRVRKILAQYRQETLEKHNALSKSGNARTVTYQGGMLDIAERVELSDDDLLSPEAIMRACNIDPAKFEVVTFQHSEWDGMAKVDNKMKTKRLYSIKLKVRPIKQGFDLDACLEKIKRMEPVEILPNRIPGRGLLEVFLSDAHFGLDNNYTGLLEEIVERCKAVEEVVIIIGSDGLHVDNVNHTTLKGTVLEEIDLNDAWEQMYELYFNLIYQCLRMGKRTLVKYLRGNHDATSGFLFAKTLEKVLPDAEYDLSMEQYKAHRFGNVGIGWTHGDKGKRNEYDKLFYRRFPWIFADASRCEIHYGHIHQETVKDSYATKIRSMPTAAAQSEYTIDNGYESAQEFQLFEYSEDKLKTIHYI